MTQWVENPSGGRARGPRAAVRAWVEVIVRPRRFFRTGVAPGDQGPGFVFTVAVAAVAVGSRLALVPAARPGGPFASLLLAAGLSVIAAPLALHLVAAVQTVTLMALTSDRGTISETVQVLAYSTAPCVAAGAPVAALRVAVTTYGAVLLVVGTAEVHDLSRWRAVAVAALPATLVFGLAFGGFDAVAALAP
ncbi:MAG: YIP1 family protein [Halobacteriaceae archaeon]